VLGVLQTEAGPKLLSDDPSFAGIAAAMTQIGVSGAVDELKRLPSPEGSATPIALIGLGKEVTANSLRGAAGAAARQLSGIVRLALALPVASAVEAQAVLEGAGIGAYAYTDYRVATKGSTKTPASNITVVVRDADADDSVVARAIASVTAIHTVRDLVNMPPSDLYPETPSMRAASGASWVWARVRAGGPGWSWFVTLRRVPTSTWRSLVKGSPSTLADSR